MKKQIIKLTLLLCIVSVLTYAFRQDLFFHVPTVRAFGDLAVDFHVPAGTPLFSLTTMAPGNSISKTVDVSNGGTIAHDVLVKGIRTGGTGTPQLEHVLLVTITGGTTILYSKTVENFFADSSSSNGIILGSLNPLAHKSYTFTVVFPQSAGNDYQAKSVVFDLTFGTSDSKNVVINEVYYGVDSRHGLDSPKDRGVIKGDKLGITDEWVELYNPTDHDISLKDWTITDNSGNPTIIHPNKTIRANGYALLSKDGATWKYWTRKIGAEVIELGGQIGDGLDNAGDHLILRNNQGQEVDRMSWGNDTSGFTPFAINPLVPLESSTERINPGFDTNKASDWKTKTPPDPGY